MAQNTSDLIGTEVQEPAPAVETETIVDTEPEVSNSGSETSTPDSSSGNESEYIGSTSPVTETVYVQSSEYEVQILQQIKVTNGLMGISIAFQIFFLALFFLVFFIKIIKNNVTNLTY